MLLCLVVCLTLLTSFFLPSHLSLKHVYIFYVPPLCAQSSSELLGHIIGHIIKCFPNAQAGCKPQKSFLNRPNMLQILNNVICYLLIG